MRNKQIPLNVKFDSRHHFNSISSNDNNSNYISINSN